MKKLVVANWKMNGSPDLVEIFAENDAIASTESVDVVVCPPTIYLRETAIKAKRFLIGAQDCSQMNTGAFTGDTSAKMLKISGVSHVIVGHSERRNYQNETNDTCAAKAVCAQKAGITPIFCIGESQEAYEAGLTLDVLTLQLESLIVHGVDFGNIIIAYEPIWSIGTGKIPSMETIQSILENIKTWLLQEVGPTAANETPVLYGGSVNPDNAEEIMKLKSVDGFLVGGASLNPEHFTKLVDAVCCRSIEI